MHPPFTDDDRCRAVIDEFVEGETGQPAAAEAIGILIATAPDLTPESLRAVGDVPDWDLDAGVAAAAAFRR